MIAGCLNREVLVKTSAISTLQFVINLDVVFTQRTFPKWPDHKVIQV